MGFFRPSAYSICTGIALLGSPWQDWQAVPVPACRAGEGRNGVPASLARWP